MWRHNTYGQNCVLCYNNHFSMIISPPVPTLPCTAALNGISYDPCTLWNKSNSVITAIHPLLSRGQSWNWIDVFLFLEMLIHYKVWYYTVNRLDTWWCHNRSMYERTLIDRIRVNISTSIIYTVFKWGYLSVNITTQTCTNMMYRGVCNYFSFINEVLCKLHEKRRYSMS